MTTGRPGGQFGVGDGDHPNDDATDQSSGEGVGKGPEELLGLGPGDGLAPLGSIGGFAPLDPRIAAEAALTLPGGDDEAGAETQSDESGPARTPLHTGGRLLFGGPGSVVDRAPSEPADDIADQPTQTGLPTVAGGIPDEASTYTGADAPSQLHVVVEDGVRYLVDEYGQRVQLPNA